ncbi:hypothetical protein JG688_00009211 [Phytophthora aleatoria]|uniref:AAA+ ATPase domain-containing protein n=1 Tax=Phytophthora aleatoria TaxID=2496075 RepID=A0A8J5IXI6_9STRA|nr:hypothetical protein JG688_00009211 [Phytophthora aleatoria]
MADGDAGCVTYELLRTHGDLDNAETHKAMLRALSSVRVDRQSADVLQRLHATDFALLRVRKRREDINHVSNRRSRVRDKWRQRRQQEGATLEDVQRRYPKLFEGAEEERIELKKPSAVFNDGGGMTMPPQAVGHAQAPSAPAPAPVAVLQPVAATPVVPARVETRRNDFNFTDDVWSGPPQAARFSMPSEPAPQPKPALSDLLSKKSRLPHEDPELFVSKKFVSPMNNGGASKGTKKQTTPPDEDEYIDPRLKSCDPELIEKIEMEIVDNGDPITFDDIAGLQFAKKCVNELVIWPMARPDIFTGLRSLPKGLLLFGPPGTGKTLIGKAIASQSGATFFSISASSLTSKWIGQGEKLVRTLFAVAAVKQPSVIFIDEIDSLLTQRSSEENEASRRMKTEFLVQLDGAGTKAKDIILVVGATNRPQELDEAARRRFVKRLYIPLPSFEARLDLVSRLLNDNKNDLTDGNKTFIAESTKGYSGADVRALCTEAAMGPIRTCADIRTMDADSVRPINLDDFKEALRGVRSSVAVKDLAFYKEWNEEFGSFAFESHDSS